MGDAVVVCVLCVDYIKVLALAWEACALSAVSHFWAQMLMHTC